MKKLPGALLLLVVVVVLAALESPMRFSSNGSAANAMASLSALELFGSARPTAAAAAAAAIGSALAAIECAVANALMSIDCATLSRLLVALLLSLASAFAAWMPRAAADALALLVVLLLVVPFTDSAGFCSLTIIEATQ